MPNFFIKKIFNKLKKKNYPIKSSSSDFKSTVNQLIKKYKPKQIIETGSYKGLGSTLVFAKTKKPVISIECNRDYAMKARRNLKNYNNVIILNAHSLKKKDLIKFIDNYKYKYPKNIAREVDDKFFYKYKNEINVDSDFEDALFFLINNNKRQIVFLDSAGGVGYLEFKTFMKLPKKNLNSKILILDDVMHIKHYRSVKELKNMGYKPKIINNRFAYLSFIN